MSEKPVSAAVTIFKPDQELIDVLKDLLAEAERGELRAIAFAAIYGEGLASHGWSNAAGVDHDKILSRITRLQLMFASRFGD